MKKYLLTSSLLILLAGFSFGQGNKEFSWDKLGCSVAINSIHGQIETPIAVGGGIAIDADGNFVNSGDKNANSLSISIIPKYFLSDDVLLRFEFGITNISLKNHFEASNPNMTANQSFDEKIFRYLPGVQWIFFRKGKVESYCGMTASYINFKTSIYNSYDEYRYPDNSINYWTNIKQTMPGGFAAGVNVLTGCNFYLQKHFSFGAEISSAMLYYKLGGKTISENGGQVIPNPSVTITSGYSDSFKGFKIPALLPSFNISVRF